MGPTGPRYQAGDRVVLRREDEDGVVSEEKGVVVCTWLIDQGVYDCYVAFFGTEWPEPDQNPPKPYVLRYYDTSLEPAS